MGLHYVNFPLVLDGELDATRPEIVIYEPLPNGRLQLIGADYLVLADAWHAKHPEPPQLMGQLLHLFEAPNRFGLPAFYTLHVWAWKENPDRHVRQLAQERFLRRVRRQQPLTLREIDCDVHRGREKANAEVHDPAHAVCVRRCPGNV